MLRDQGPGTITTYTASSGYVDSTLTFRGGTELGDSIAAYNGMIAFTTPGGSVFIDGIGTIEHFSDFAGLPRVLDYDFDPITGDFHVLRDQGPGTITTYTASSGYVDSTITFRGGTELGDSIAIHRVTSVPEPNSLLLATAGLCLFALRRRRSVRTMGIA
ncbi:MAG: PEP-CTERM sorting domain-containing protein [Pirellulaceae bacterium]